MLFSPVDSTHFEGNLAAIIRSARQLEALDGVLDVCTLPVQPWMDIEEMGCALVVTATEAGVPVDALEQLGQEWYDQRHVWKDRLTRMSELLAALHHKREQPYILVDPADATSAGAPGNSAEMLRRLLPYKDELPGKVLLWVVDPGTVAAARSGATSFTTGEPAVHWNGRVSWTGVGNYVARGKAYTGQRFSMGEAPVIECGQIQLVACSLPAVTPEPAFYECVGLKPDEALAIMAKSMTGWMAAFDAGWERSFLFGGPGICSLNFAKIPFTGSGRRLYPVDPSLATPVEIWGPGSTAADA